jgi:orotate phosphoribosyltransferase
MPPAAESRQGRNRAPLVDECRDPMDLNVLNLMSLPRGHFRYESGYHGEIWLDLDRLFFDPHRLAPFVRELAANLRGDEVEVVVGPLVGGAFLANMVAAELGSAFAYAERLPPTSGDALASVEYRLPAAVAPLLSGKRVAIVDDAVNAGSALRGTFAACVEVGAEPTVAGALIILGDAASAFAAAKGIRLVSLATLPHPLWTPADCPLCARGTPLD